MSSGDLAEKLLLQEEAMRLQDKALGRLGKELKQPLLKISSALEKAAKKTDIVMAEVKEDNETSSHWYQSGIITITSATSVGTYPNVENIITTLGHIPESGWVQNFGPGLLFVVFSKSPADTSANELRIEPYAVFPFAKTQWNYSANYISLRSDADDTQYQVVAY